MSAPAYATRHRQRWTEAERHEAVRLYRDGMTARAVAVALGRTACGVEQVLSAQGVCRRDRGQYTLAVLHALPTKAAEAVTVTVIAQRTGLHRNRVTTLLRALPVARVKLRPAHRSSRKDGTYHYWRLSA